ncbi:MAG: TIM barrel protein [Kiritimatiellae bacterium]|nr:TIM barrel protein [Kiritimatiellia bacterium]MDD5520137.1 TIM barrel protein [Kiritimatiellia bacterium]
MNNSTKEKTVSISRRDLLWNIAGGAILVTAGSGSSVIGAEDKPASTQLKGRIKQAACGGVFGKNKTFEEKCEICTKLGLKGMDFIGPNDWPTLKKYGLICTMVQGGARGFNRKENHDSCIESLKKNIALTADAGFPNVVVFSGNRDGISDEAGMENCAEGLKKIAAFAEEKKINVCMELLNSKRNHKGYQCDRTAWGAEVCKKVGSPRIKLLYDIYHMQVQEGDVIATIRENIQYIGHFHTAGVPGRNEIDESQELYYPAIMQAIVDLKYEGYVAHEYSPKKDPIESLKKAIQLCDI